MSAKAELEWNIFDLTEHESASLGLPHAVLLIKAFKAIARGELPARFDTHPSPNVPAVRAQITQNIFALEQNPHFFVRWFRLVMVNVGDYARWRDATLKVAPTPRSVPIGRKKVQEGIKIYLEGEHAADRTGSQKRAWEWARAAMPGCRYRQVIDALIVVEGGKKLRGRPRKA